MLVAYQIGYEQRAFWRNRSAAFFTFAFPLLLLVIFGSLNRANKITTLGVGHLAFTEYFVPSMLAFGVMSACFVNVGTVLSVRRQSGQLKGCEARRSAHGSSWRVYSATPSFSPP